ncbi:FAS1-like dehydratase domain-containing protein [Roseinatronobacter monicus]|uniref:3-methylfumaryl-CoA hydratase n=1 Tax=Roseinatronobacter monicus TaxID=393481 RepID=A0A543KG55_9RHOB|nr:MaoC family dehydratase N-terminal domain-containing protein [Roseinatronobacter monicus]TQM94050.1 3-methylfumaryl-CoA hydratase [Roseinatronobacter monicus]
MSKSQGPMQGEAATPEQAQDWVGRVDSRTGAVSPEFAGMVMGALGHPAAPQPPIHTGAPLPVLWHWVAFPEFVPISEIATDGHPKLGGFLPPLPFGRRMWAGGKLSFKGRFAVGEAITKRSEILSVDFKTGHTGDMAFVRVGHDLRGEGGAQIREEQDIVYLPIPDQFRAPRAIAAPESPVFSEAVEVGPVRLFRYSAATYNAHRIHYDRDYATGAERYPGLVVHGPMQATLLMEAAMRHTGATPTRFSFRGVHPMFDGHLHLQAEADGPTALRLCTVAPEGHQGLQARFEWEG